MGVFVQNCLPIYGGRCRAAYIPRVLELCRPPYFTDEEIEARRLSSVLYSQSQNKLETGCALCNTSPFSLKHTQESVEQQMDVSLSLYLTSLKNNTYTYRHTHAGCYSSTSDPDRSARKCGKDNKGYVNILTLVYMHLFCIKLYVHTCG